MSVNAHAPYSETLNSASAGQWQNAGWGILFVMWGVMMAAMMAPAAVPFLRLFWRCCLHFQMSFPSAAARTVAAAGGYLLLWLGFSALAALLHWAANHSAMAGETMALQSPELRAAVFALAGVYQFTPLKSACLRGCRPLPMFMIMHWKNTVSGALQLGARNGAYCVGCCWALMLLLFAGGVMDLRWIGALALYALMEKIFPDRSGMLARITGGGLLMLAAWTLWSAPMLAQF